MDECADAYLMARVGAIAPAKAHGYFARRSAIELMVLDGLTLGSALAVIAPRMHEPLGMAVFLFASPGLVLTVRSIASAMGSRDGLSLSALRPGRVPARDDPTESARRLARAGLILLAAPLAPMGVVLTAAAALS